MLTQNQPAEIPQQAGIQDITRVILPALKMTDSHTFRNTLNCSKLKNRLSRRFRHFSTKTLNKGSFSSRIRARRRERFS